MSGIAGIYNLNSRPVEKTDLEQMVGVLARRGPDGSGIWNNGSVGLGHAMLWTTPESLHERLPVTNSVGTLAITADARIDNRDELISALSLDSRPPEEIGDTELILLAYEKWGEHCPAKLLGDFAFAIWDKCNQKIFCARDHFGVKPFYYFYQPHANFVFGSEPKAILANRTVPSRINEPRIADYLVWELEGIDKISTFYEDIFRLPPAHTLTLSREGLRAQSYWELYPCNEIRYGSDEEYVEAFRDIFTEAVRCRLRSASPPASMLSGGIDSASIVGTAKKLLAGNGKGSLRTFSAVSANDPKCEETNSIKAVLNLNGLRSFSVQPDQLDPLAEDLKYIPRHADNLFQNKMIIPQLMYIAAHNQGIKVLLDGVDGDLVASNSEAYIAYLLRAGMWKKAATEASGYSHFWSDYEPGPWRVIFRNIRAAFVPETLRRIRRRLLRLKMVRDATKETVINADFARRVDLAERFDTMRRNTHPTRCNTLREVHCNTLNAPFITVALERYDGVAAAYSIESRHPFFDKRVVEFCLALPWEQKVYRGCSKTILRRAAARILPEEISWRAGKDHLGPEFFSSLLAHEQELLNGLFQHQLGLISEYVNVTLLKEAYQRHSSHASSLEDVFRLWEAVTLSLWLSRN